MRESLVRSPKEAGSRGSDQSKERYGLLVWLIWSYFILLIIEGALRKWFLPSLATPLLIVRDPVVILIYALAASRKIFPVNGFFGAGVIIAVLSFVFSMLAGHGNLSVTLFGVRTNFLHYPLVFIMPLVLRGADVRKLALATLLASAPVSILMVAQFRAPEDSFLNRTASGEGSQLFAAQDKIRPAGTFSFVTGSTQFLTLVSVFLAYGLLVPKMYPRVIVFGALGCLFLSIAVSGSRSTVLGVMTVVLTAFLLTLYRPKLLNRYAIVLGVVWLIYTVVAGTGIFQNGLAVLTDRFEGASEAEGGKEGSFKRLLGEFTGPWKFYFGIPFFGMGTGMGTNVGSRIMTGEMSFLLSEGEWGRLLFELGPVLGLAGVLYRVVLFGYMVKLAFEAIKRNVYLPLLICGGSWELVLLGQAGQSTTLGFLTWNAGLCLAAARNEEAETPVTIPEAESSGPKAVRGRSVGSQRLLKRKDQE